MKLRNRVLTAAISVWMLGGMTDCSSPNKNMEKESDRNQTEVFEESPVYMLEIPKEDLIKINENNDTKKIKEKTAEQISVCLDTDGKGTFTHTTVLNSIKDPNNSILEFPLWQLFEKYWERPHPLSVRGIKRNFRSLLWEGWIESLNSKVPQKLSKRTEWVTSNTEYMINDTLRFPLINPLLKDDFPKFLPEQLKEEWFEDFSDSHELLISRRLREKNKSVNDSDEKMEHIYDVVVKQVPSWKSALAVYRDWEFFMATYVSVWRPSVKVRRWRRSAKTKTWQFEILGKNPYYYSRKYKSPMPNWLNFDEWWYWFHQWNVTWYPASHWCVRLPWVYSQVLYSLLKDAKWVDIFISKSLYKSEK